jgi:hypothetical protein
VQSLFTQHAVVAMHALLATHVRWPLGHWQLPPMPLQN